MTTPQQNLTEQVMKKIDFNSHDMGEMGKFIRVDYAKNILSSTLQDLEKQVLGVVDGKRRNVISSESEFNTAWRIGYNSGLDYLRTAIIKLFRGEK